MGVPTIGLASGFHAYKSVAPLKPFSTDEMLCGLAKFPRLQKRGPIEADRAAC